MDPLILAEKLEALRCCLVHTIAGEGLEEFRVFAASMAALLED